MFMTKQCCKWVLALTVAFTPLYAQSSDPPGTINGADNPDQIPDVVAFRLFLGALSAGSATPAAQTGTNAQSPLQPTPSQRAKLNPCALNASDTSALLQSLGTWQTSVKPSAASPSVDLDGVTQSTMGTLQQQMSPSGFNSLMAQVRSEKTHMKIIPMPSMGN